MDGLLGGGGKGYIGRPSKILGGPAPPAPPPVPTPMQAQLALMRFQASAYARCPEPHHLKGHWNGLECPPDINQTDRQRQNQTDKQRKN